MRRWILILAPVLVLAVVIAWQAGDDPTPPPPDVPPVSPDRPMLPPGLPPPARLAKGGEIGESEDPAAEDAATEREVVARVRVLGPDDRPLAGVWVHGPDRRMNESRTGPDGWADLTWKPVDGKLRIVVSGIVPVTNVSLEPDRLPNRETILRYPDLLPLTVDLIDGETGRPVRGATMLLMPKKSIPVPMPRAGIGFGLPVAPIRRGEMGTVRLRPELPEGYVLERGDSVAASGTISRFTERVAVTVVAWPEADVRVRVEEEDGRPAAETLITTILTSLSRRITSAPTDGRGETRLRGMPRIPDETIVAFVDKDGRKARTTDGRIDRSGSAILLLAVLPPKAPPTAADSSLIGMGGGAGGAFGGRGSRRRLGPTPTTTLYVRVLRRDGSPAKDALVVVGGHGRLERGRRTDADGSVTFRGLDPGPASVFVREPGFLMGPPVEVQLENGTEVRAEIVEARETYLQLRVTTDDGLPALFAEITVRALGKVPFTHLVDGVQRLNLFADVDGRIVLPHLPGSKARISARLGSRSASVESGPEGYSEIVLPRVK